MGMPLEQAFRILLDTRPCHSEEDWVRTYRAIYAERAEHTRLFPGAVELLNSARRRRIRILLISNKGTAALTRGLRRFGVLEDIDVVLGADVVPYRKPDPRLYNLSIKSVLPDLCDRHVLVVGDTETDIAFAQACGLDSCWAAYGYGDHARCEALNPTKVINELQELSALLPVPEDLGLP